MRHQNCDSKAAIRMPRVAAAVLAFELLMKSVRVINFPRLQRLLQFRHNSVPLGIHIRADVMRDLSSLVTQAHTLVKGRRTKPDRPIVPQFVPTPKPDVMPLAWAMANRLLEGCLLYTSPNPRD